MADLHNDVRMLFEIFDDTQNRVLHDRIWTGEGTLTFEGHDWIGVGAIVAVSEAKAEFGAPSSRLELAIAATDPAVRAAAERDPGPRRCELRWIYATDGETWQAVPRRHVGRLSAPVLGETTFSVTLELESGDRDNLAPVMWSDQDFRRRSEGGVTYGGGAYLAELEAGLTVRWPA